MSASGPPSDDLPPLHGRTGPQSFAWGKSPNVVSEIVGRDHELARVRALLEATREGATTTLLVEGEPGIGKTTLLEAAAADGHGLPVSVGAGASSPNWSWLTQGCCRRSARFGIGWPRYPARRPTHCPWLSGGDQPRLLPSAFWLPRRCCPCSPRSQNGHRSLCWSTTCSGSTGSRQLRSGLRLVASARTQCALCGRCEAARSHRSSCRECPS